MSYVVLLVLAWLALGGAAYLTNLAGYAGQMTLVSYFDDPAMKYLAAPEHAFILRSASLGVTLLSLGLLVAAHLRASAKWPFWSMRDKAEDAALARALRHRDWSFIRGRMKLALVRDPQNGAAVANLGLALWGLGRTDEARAALEQAVEMSVGGRIPRIMDLFSAGRSPERLIRRPVLPLLTGLLGVFILFKAGFMGESKGHDQREYGVTHYDNADFRFMFTPHYKVSFHDSGLADNLSGKLEDMTAILLDDLGIQPEEMTPGYIQIFICNDENEYRNRNRAVVSSWAGGHAFPENRTLFVYPNPTLMIETLPHELTHILLGQFTGCNQPWIQEGVATYLGLLYAFRHEHGQMPLALDQVRLFELLKGGKHFHMSDLMTLNPQGLENENRVDVFYIQAFSIIYFLREKYGADKFHNFIREMKRLNDPKAALTSAYREEFKDFDDLEGTWLVYFTL